MIHASNRVRFSVQAQPESYIPSVLCALNGDWSPRDRAVRSAYRRRTLIVLIKRIQQVEAAAGEIGRLFHRLVHGEIQVATLIGSPELVKLQDKLDRFLMRFQASPRIQLHPVLKPGAQENTAYWGLSWTAPSKRTRFWYEVPLLDGIVQIAKTGNIKALRQCEQCKRWMFARRPAKDRFCTPECRDKFHRTNEADRLRRREWAKTNYQNRKILESGSKKAAEIRRKSRKR